MIQDKVYIFDTTLRDGEQSPGFSMGIEEKINFAKQLQKMKVDVIEAGFPISSDVQFDAVQRISEEIEGPTIAGLARALEKDITTCYDAIKKANRPRIHTFIATSPIHMEYKLKKSPDKVLEMAVESVQLAKSLCDDIEFSAEDASRSDINFLCEITEAVITAGARVVNIPDTVGYTTPEEFYQIIKTLHDKVPNINNAIISVHCHNDLGLAVANSLAAIKAGARQVECTINGIGERAGNASLEEIVMALNVRKNVYQVPSTIDTHEIYRSSSLLSHITGISVQPNKAIVGKNAFAHESGIHQDGMLKNHLTYEIMTPQSIGRPKSSMVLGRHSGKHGLKSRLIDLGITLNEDNLTKVYNRFLELADKKKEVFDEDLFAIVADEIRHTYQSYKIFDFHTFCGSDPTIASATVILENEDEKLKGGAKGDGPIDALFNAIDSVTDVNVKLEEFKVNAITPGREAMGEVNVKLSYDGITTIGIGWSTDIIYASGKAYVDGINKIIQQKEIKKMMIEDKI